MNGLMMVNNMTKTPARQEFATPRMQIIWEVLEAAKDARDATVISACRRLILANRHGWRMRARQADIALVHEFADSGA